MPSRRLLHAWVLRGDPLQAAANSSASLVADVKRTPFGARPDEMARS